MTQKRTNSGADRLFRSLKSLFNLPGGDTEASIKQNAAQVTKHIVQPTFQAGVAQQLGQSGVVQAVTLAPSAKDLPYSVFVDAVDDAPDLIGAILVQAMDVKTDRGAFTVADYPISEAIEQPVIVVRVVDETCAPVSINDTKLDKLKEADELGIVLSALSTMSGKPLKVEDMKPDGTVGTLSLYDLLRFPAVGALNSLSPMLKGLSITDDAAFVMLFAEAVMRRTDMNVISNYLTHKE